MPYSIDQSYTTGQDNADGSGIGNLRRAVDNNIILAQSFTPTILGTLPQFDFYMKKVGSPTGNIWAQIFTDAGGPGTGVQLGSDSATVDVSTVSTSYVYQSFTFSSVINTNPGVKLWAYLLGDYTLVIDDLIKNKYEAYNENILEGHWDFYVNTFLSRLEEGAFQIVVMTRWNSRDLCGRLLNEYGDDWFQILFQAHDEKTDQMLS